MAKVREMFTTDGFLKRSFFAKELKMTPQAFHNKMNPNQVYERFTPDQIKKIMQIVNECKDELERIIEEGLTN